MALIVRLVFRHWGNADRQGHWLSQLVAQDVSDVLAQVTFNQLLGARVWNRDHRDAFHHCRGVGKMQVGALLWRNGRDVWVLLELFDDLKPELVEVAWSVRGFSHGSIFLTSGLPSGAGIYVLRTSKGTKVF